jgi:hypothetical protein
MGAVLVLLSLAAAGPVIHAEGTNGCPDAAAISQRLAGLLSASAEPSEPDRVDLSLDGPDLRLRLSRADGSLVAERRIPRSRRCAELADAVAALVAAWEADLRPLAQAPPPPPAPPPVAPAPVAPVPEAPATPILDPLPQLELEQASREQQRAAYEVGVLPALWLGGGRLSFAGTLRGGVWSRRSPVGLTLALSATFPFEGASARWRRHALSAGVMGRLRHRWLFVDGLGEAVLGWLIVSESSGARASFDPGLTIGLRAGTRVARRLELYVSLTAWGAAWTRSDGLPSSALPHWALLTGMGGSFLFGL